jgi:glycosyltransferase involved in cell wall biosynthesis
MKILVWQWSRLGGPPRFGVMLARALAAQPGVTAALSLSTRARLPRDLARCDLPVDTYDTLLGFIGRVARAPFDLPGLTRRVRRLAPDLAICAQPGPLDLLMATALRRLGVPFIVLVHDATAHPGDGMPMQMTLQRWLCRRSSGVAALTGHVAEALRKQELGCPLLLVSHPPMAFGSVCPGERIPGPRRLLCFGRLLAYKGLDLLAEALALVGPRDDLVVRIVGNGPDSPVLAILRAQPHVTVENRWVPEDEVGALLAWADALVLPYREASQSGVAAAALAAGRPVLATRVGGLVEQLEGRPGAILCEPSGAGVAGAMKQWLDGPALQIPPEDATAAWNAMAASLLRQVRPAH